MLCLSTSRRWCCNSRPGCCCGRFEVWFAAIFPLVVWCFLLIIDGFFWRSWLICVLTFLVACFFVLVDCCDSFLMVFVLSLMFYWLRVIMLDCFWLLVECEWLFLDVCWLLLPMFDSFWFCLIILRFCLWLCLIVFECSLFFVHWFRLLSIVVECFWLLSCALSDLQIGIYLKN